MDDGFGGGEGEENKSQRPVAYVISAIEGIMDESTVSLQVPQLSISVAISSSRTPSPKSSRVSRCRGTSLLSNFPPSKWRRLGMSHLSTQRHALSPQQHSGVVCSRL
jgi:hypothetical protein